MKLISFSVDKYRSITRARKLAIQDLTILIGPNNEGKSNILRALVTVLDIVASLSQTTVFRGRLRLFRPFGPLRKAYDWEKDFPVSLQGKYPDGESIFNLEFELTDAEIDQFKEEVKSMIDGFLPIQVTIGKKEPGFKIMKRGPGGKALSTKAAAIAQFIGKRFEFQYIPTVRTADVSESVVEELVAKELSVVEREPLFRSALQEVYKQYAPVLERLSETITSTLKGFLPNIRNVSVKNLEEAAHRALRRSFEIIVDDGTPTSLQQKGDGVQSLAALGLLRYASQSQASGRSLVLAIEEPESHLHPRAIHQLKDVLRDISEKNQIIITTHCPLFVNRAVIGSNILVSGNRATPAKNTDQIRDILGVRHSDNLRGAEIVLVVEGEDDRIALQAVLPTLSGPLKSAFATNVITIDTLHGGSNLAYKLSQIRDALCLSHALLDYDDCGREAFDRAKNEGLIVEADVTFTTYEGMPDSEIEDVYEKDIYAPKMLNAYGVNLDCPKFKTNRKWSDRMRDAFRQHGKPWDDKYESKIKLEVAELVAVSPEAALNKHKRAFLDALVVALETKLKAVPSKPKPRR